MSNRRRNLFVLAFVALLIVGSAIVIATKKTTLGLDLNGGTRLIFQARPTPQNPTIDGSDIDRAIEIIRKRTDAFGVSEPEISRIGSDEIQVGLPDVSNASHAEEQVGKTAQLYFYDWEPNVIPNPAKTNVPRSESSFSRLYDAVKLASQQQPNCFDNKCTTTGPEYYLFNAQTHAWIAGPAQTQKDLFAQLPGQKQPPNSEIIAVPQGTLVIQKEGANGSAAPDNPNDPSSEWFVIRDRPALSGTDIRDPKPNTDSFGQPIVTFNFSDTGRKEFSDVTRTIAQRGLQNAPPGVAGNSQAADAYSGHFAVVLDQQIKSRPIVNFVDNPDGIDGSNGAEINGLTFGESQDLSQILQIGALPVTLDQISSETVSATLGQQALDQGLKAGIVGLILVCLFLLAYYRFLGFVAVLGLAIYGLFFFALIKLIPITLTLPGIAGLILTIGVAADANIIIFERIKEEARSGRSMLSAIATGYRRGIATIIDANVITLITAFILFALATANVKGFAFTLGVGTIASLFTAVVFTQAFLGIFGRARFMRSPAALGANPEQRVRWHFDFSRASKYFFTLSGCILLVGALAFATKQLNLGIDFKGGSRITVGLTKPATVDQVRTTVENAGVTDAEVTKATNKQLGTNVFDIDSKANPQEVRGLQPALQSQYGIVPNGFNATTVGPTFGTQVAKSAIYAIIFSLLVICGYVAFRFEPKYAVPVIIAVIHDVLITGGVYSLTGREVTSGTVAAFLTILGYSLYDTVIVFDRIRENVPRLPRATFSQIVNRSMSEVLTRSLITGLSSVFLVTVLYIFGGATLKDFAFAMMVGLLSGTYSSIFIASPVLTHWKEREPAYRRRRERIEEQLGRVPAFPEENVVARTEGGPEEPVRAETPVPAAPAPSRSQVPGVVPEPPGPVPPPPAPEPAEPPAPVGAPRDGGPDGGDGQPGGDGAPESSVDGLREDGGNGTEAPPRERPELSEASAAALRRVREQQSGGRRQKRRKKHGRNR
ncbi:MAG TPA: protein translocase subunit SecD [Solirubrobacterales bacterium]|nr:protein translocase subunit SecD [Solirubrobacterales bacterium]